MNQSGFKNLESRSGLVGRVVYQVLTVSLNLELVPAKTLVVYDLFKFLEGADGSISPDRIKMDLQLLLWHCRTNSFEKGKRTIMELWDQFECKKCYIFKARLNISIWDPKEK